MQKLKSEIRIKPMTGKNSHRVEMFIDTTYLDNFGKEYVDVKPLGSFGKYELETEIPSYKRLYNIA